MTVCMVGSLAHFHLFPRVAHETRTHLRLVGCSVSACNTEAQGAQESLSKVGIFRALRHPGGSPALGEILQTKFSHLVGEKCVFRAEVGWKEQQAGTCSASRPFPVQTLLEALLCREGMCPQSCCL